MSKRIPRKVIRYTRWNSCDEGWEVELIKPRGLDEIYHRLAELEDLEELIKRFSKDSSDLCDALEKYYVVVDSRQVVNRSKNK